MRWLISPTAETYARIPDHSKPTMKQRFIPHIPPIDAFPSAEGRDGMIDNLRDYVTVTANHMSINWHYGDSCLVKRDGRIFLSAEFLEHCQDVTNYSVTRGALDVFPEIAGTAIRVVDENPPHVNLRQAVTTMNPAAISLRANATQRLTSSSLSPIHGTL